MNETFFAGKECALHHQYGPMDAGFTAFEGAFGAVRAGF